MKEGQILEEFTVGKEQMMFRLARKGDAEGLRDHVNALVREGARIALIKKMTLKEEQEWLEDVLKKQAKGEHYHVVVECEGKIVGGGNICISLGRGRATQHVATIGFGLSGGVRGKGVGERLGKLMIALAQKEFKSEIVRSSYFSDNEASARLHKKLGFRAVGRIPRGGKYGKKYLDEIIMVKEL